MDLAHDSASEAGDIFDLAWLTDTVRRTPRTVNEAFQLWVIYNLLLWRKKSKAEADMSEPGEDLDALFERQGAVMLS